MNPRHRRILVLLAFIAFLAVLVHFLSPRPPTPDATMPASASPSAAAPTTKLAAKKPRDNASWQRTLRLQQGEAQRDPTRRAGAFEGRVISSARGEGIAGAELTFEHGGAVSAVASGEDGVFHFEPTEPGLYLLALVTAKGHHAFAPDFGESPITLSAREGEVVRGITIALKPAVTYDGMVMDARGSPVPGAVVRVIEGSRETSAGGRGSRWRAR